MKLSYHPTHGYHYVQCYRTKCPRCGIEVLYWECDCGSKCFLDLDLKTNHQDTCVEREINEYSIYDVVEICSVCERYKIQGLSRRKYFLIERRLLPCHLVKFSKSHIFLLIGRRNNNY